MSPERFHVVQYVFGPDRSPEKTKLFRYRAWYETAVLTDDHHPISSINVTPPPAKDQHSPTRGNKRALPSASKHSGPSISECY